MMVRNNRDLNRVIREERVRLGSGKTESTQSIPGYPTPGMRSCWD